MDLYFSEPATNKKEYLKWTKINLIIYINHKNRFKFYISDVIYYY